MQSDSELYTLTKSDTTQPTSRPRLAVRRSRLGRRTCSADSSALNVERKTMSVHTMHTNDSKSSTNKLVNKLLSKPLSLALTASAISFVSTEQRSDWYAACSSFSCSTSLISCFIFVAVGLQHNSSNRQQTSGALYESLATQGGDGACFRAAALARTCPWG